MYLKKNKSSKLTCIFYKLDSKRKLKSNCYKIEVVDGDEKGRGVRIKMFCTEIHSNCCSRKQSKNKTQFTFADNIKIN